MNREELPARLQIIEAGGIEFKKAAWAVPKDSRLPPVLSKLGRGRV